MKLVIQRVSSASVKIEGTIKATIGQGFMTLLGIEEEDTETDIEWLCKKMLNLRVFSDEEGKMNLSLQDIKGEILLISQFTLYASTKKGNRPSFTKAAKPTIAIPLYDKFIDFLAKDLDSRIKTGEFGADMKVSLINDGPVTIIIDSKNKV